MNLKGQFWKAHNVNFPKLTNWSKIGKFLVQKYTDKDSCFGFADSPFNLIIGNIHDLSVSSTTAPSTMHSTTITGIATTEPTTTTKEISTKGVRQ